MHFITILSCISFSKNFNRCQLHKFTANQNKVYFINNLTMRVFQEVIYEGKDRTIILILWERFNTN